MNDRPVPPVTAAELRLRWMPAVERLPEIPAEYRRPELSVRSAARLLGVDEQAVKHLIDAGLPAQEQPYGMVLDRYDLLNLGLLAGTGRSAAEAAELRWTAQPGGPPAGWTTARRLRLALASHCSAGCTRAPGPPLCATALAEQTATVHTWRTLRPGGRVLAEVTLRGRRCRARSRAAREVFGEIYDGLLTGRYRYARLPPALAARPERALAAGALDPVTAALVMAVHARAAGLEARTRAGFLLAPPGPRQTAALPHAWTEIRECGHWLPLDPLQAYRAGRHPDFADFCRGSRPNWLLPLTHEAHCPATAHRCSDGGVPETSCRQLPGGGRCP
ncbi:transglutaminase-like domain-containing protein [Streptomyces purpureus]|uniref:transglutaminase-like domain-containing protein n=1 Tax=Streptomyces purpureus TaxID=1951 RepID=UPI0037BAC31B